MNGIATRRKITCRTISVDKRPGVYYELHNAFNVSIQRKFNEFEALFEKVKNVFPMDYDRPPKKKILLSESKLAEKRRLWLEQFANDAIDKHGENSEIRSFFKALEVEADEDNVNLGPKEVKTLRPDHFDFLKTIGKGSFGRVYLVRYKTDGKIYAMKILGKAKILKRNEIKHVMAERNVLKSNINHPFLVSLHYSFQTKEKLYFVLDFLNGGELFHHLQKERSFTETRARFYAAEIASAIGYLHSCGIIYRDLKPENLLLDRYGHVVLTDFGLCKEGVRSTDTTSTFCGTPEYLAPEIIQRKPYGHAVDWWTLGAVLYEMMFGLPPFYSKDHKEMYEKIVYQPLNVPGSTSANARQILKELLNKDRDKRLGSAKDIQELKEHPFFHPIDWDKLLRREMKPPFVPRVRNELDTLNIASEFTDIEPNPASLIPHTMHKGNDTEFAGFTFNPSAILNEK
ncbi:Serine/threonine-protein kinase sgk-1 [Aphelenchoides bicaudatus]|nr:Serine/threonine-protein kinase sgk-1 [Aphelenchoides bicaudatus]